MSDEFKIYKIILIEDDMDLCQGWRDVFEMLGHELTAHQRSLDALVDTDAIKSSDLLITDYYLPDLNGTDLIKKVREINPDLPAILLTGSREPSVVEVAKAIPRCAILHKPLNIDELEKGMNELMEAQ